MNYHTLADFRVEKQNELDELFTQVLAALSKEGLIKREEVMQDGTKIRAAASPEVIGGRAAFGNIGIVRGGVWRRWASEER